MRRKTPIVKRIQLALDKENFEKLEELRKLYGYNTSDVLRDALGSFYWTHMKLRAGYDIGLVVKGRLESVVRTPFHWRQFFYRGE